MGKRMISGFIAAMMIFTIAAFGTPTVFAAGDIVISPGTSGYTELKGTWKDSSVPDSAGGKTRYSEETGSAVEWRPALENGSYTVYIYKVQHATADNKAKVEIVHASGTEVKEIDYTKGSAEWVELGTFQFAGGTSGYVKLTRVSITARAGSVKFVKQGAAGGVRKAFRDTQDSVYKDSIDFITSLGIMEGKSGDAFKPEDSLTRGEMAIAIVRSLGLEGGMIEGSARFSDVAKDRPAVGYIETAAGTGIITGFEDGTFSPDAPVTYNQAVKMIVAMLGYSAKAAALGSYPDAWLITAGEIGVTRGTIGQGELEVSRETVAKMLDNALDIDLLVRTGFGDDLQYEANRGKTLLTEKLKLIKVEGQVTENHTSSIGGFSNLAADEVTIENMRFKTGGTNIAEMLGQYVTVYVTDDEAVPTIKAIRGDKNTNHIAIVKAEDISSDTTVTKLKYYDKNKEREYSLAIKSNANLIYNGVTLNSWTVDDLKPATGSVRLIDMEGDEIYDTVFVEDYQEYVVEDTSAGGNIIYLKYGDSSLELDTEAEEPKLSITSVEGRPLTLSDIKEWNILSVAESKDHKVKKVLVSSQSIAGRVTETEDDYVIIHDTRYKKAKSLKDKIAAHQMNPIDVDTTGTFYLDFEGSIAAFDESYATGKQYGYLVRSRIKKGLSKIAQFKIFTEQGQMTVFDSDEKIVYNGNSEEAATVQSEVYNSGTPEDRRQLIQFEVNDDNIITVLDTARNYVSNTADVTKYDVFSLDAVIATEMKYRGGGMNMFSGKYLVRGDTKIFVVPSADHADEDYWYSFRRSDYFVNNSGYKGLSFYDSTKDYKISAVVETRPYSVSYTSPVGVINKVSRSINSSGDEVYALNMFVQGKEVKYLFKNNSVKALFDKFVLTDEPSGTTVPYIDISKLEQGDVVQFTLDQFNEIKLLKVFMRANHVTDKYEKDVYGAGVPNGDYYADLYIGYGEVNDLLQEGILFDTKTSATSTPSAVQRLHIFPATVLLYEKSKHRITLVKRDEVKKGDYVFVEHVEVNPKLFVIIRP